VAPADFARLYNLAQRVTVPLLAAATNSAVLLGRRLWRETRVALFERAVDERSEAQLTRGLLGRVSFGERWLEDSVLEIFRDNATRFQIIMTRDVEQDPVALARQGTGPELAALVLHNGTVWRWNRPCFGVADGIPRLRIENRVLPAGPTVLDEVANAALFYGLMAGLDTGYGDVASRSAPRRAPCSRAKSGIIPGAREPAARYRRWTKRDRGSAQGRRSSTILCAGLRVVHARHGRGSPVRWPRLGAWPRSMASEHGLGVSMVTGRDGLRGVATGRT